MGDEGLFKSAVCTFLLKLLLKLNNRGLKSSNEEQFSEETVAIGPSKGYRLFRALCLINKRQIKTKKGVFRRWE